MIISRQPGANIIDTVDSVLALLPELRASIPPAIKLSVVQDATTTIRASVRDVKITMLISIALVILVVFLFLRSVRSTIIPSVAVPVSLVGTFGVMYLLGYSIDNLSLMALTIATGFVVDDAIVVIENITRHLERGIAPLQAALQGAKEIGFTVISISVSLIAVFIPILHDGRHRRPPVSRICRHAFARHHRIAAGIADDDADDVRASSCVPTAKKDTAACTKPAKGRFNGSSAATRRRFRWVLRHQPLTLAVTLLTMAATVYLYVIIIPKGFFPQQDTGRINGSIQSPTRTHRSRPCAAECCSWSTS